MPPKHPLSGRELLSWGVFTAPCLDPKGNPILYAVDSRHCHLPYEIGGVVSLLPTDDPIAINARLWALLNEFDPRLLHNQAS
jgi:hypothetical protein